MKEEKLKELFSDEAFVNSIMDMENAEDVQKALADKGLELSLDEINAIQRALSGEEGELDEDQLAEVAGGSWIGEVVDGIVDLGNAIHRWTRRRW